MELWNSWCAPHCLKFKFVSGFTSKNNPGDGNDVSDVDDTGRVKNDEWVV